MGKYPAFRLEIAKAETGRASANEVVDHLTSCIDADPRVALIAVFDHLAHTKAIGGEVLASIKAAYNVVFCFGLALPNADVLAVRPRSIGVCETDESFILTFMEAPMAPANEAMKAWVQALRDA